MKADLLLGLIAAACVVAPAMGHGPLLTAILHGDNTASNCSLISVSAATGATTFLSSPGGMSSLCGDVVQGRSGLPFTSWVESEGRLVFVSGAGAFVHAVDLADPDKPYVIAALPESYDVIRGLARIGDAQVVIVTDKAVYALPSTASTASKSGQVIKALDLPTPLSQDAIVASDAAGSVLYMADGGTLWRVKAPLSAEPAISKVSVTPLDAIMDLQWYDNGKVLIALQDYQLFAVNPETGKAEKKMPIPDGSGFPRLNSVPSGDTWIFADFDNLHTVDLAHYNVTGQAPFNSVLLRGYFQLYR